MQTVNESDWKLYRKKLPVWQERCMEKLIQKYVAVFNENESAGDRFWKVEKMINRDKRMTGVITEMRRSRMHGDIVQLILEGTIDISDLDGFSDELIANMKGFYNYRTDKD